MIKKILALVVAIIIIILIIVGVIKFTLGKDGVVTQAIVEEVEWSKKEVLEEINILLKPIYVEAHKESTTTGKHIDEVYNPGTIFIKLKEKNVIQNYIDSEGKDMPEKYYINIDSLKGDITLYGKGENGSGEDVFTIEFEDNIYVVNYYDNKGKIQRIGELEVVQDMQK